MLSWCVCVSLRMPFCARACVGSASACVAARRSSGSVPSRAASLAACACVRARLHAACSGRARKTHALQEVQQLHGRRRQQQQRRVRVCDVDPGNVPSARVCARAVRRWARPAAQRAAGGGAASHRRRAAYWAWSARIGSASHAPSASDATASGGTLTSPTCSMAARANWRARARVCAPPLRGFVQAR